MSIRRAALVFALASAAPLGAQPSASLDVRMRAFVHELSEHGTYGEGFRDYLPAAGPLTWVTTTRHEPGGRVTVGRWRFDAADVPRAIDEAGPLCDLFTIGGDVIPLTSFVYIAGQRPGPWRRVGPRRFVPPGVPARSGAFIQWRRENGRWVIDAIGSEEESGPRVLGVPRLGLVRDPGGPPVPGAEGPYAAGQPFFEDNMPISVGDIRLTKYGLPRPIEPEALRRLGHVDGVAAYAEAGTPTAEPEVVYLAVAPGQYAPYQNMTGSGCHP